MESKATNNAKATIISINVSDMDHSGFRFAYTQSGPHTTWLDWGDGSEREAFSEAGLIEAEHFYEKPGVYDITLFAVDDGRIGLVGIDPDIGYRSMVKAVVVGDDVSSVQAHAFSECENLETLRFEDNSIELGDYAFAGCTSLTSAMLPNSVGMIPDGLFFNCTALAECGGALTITTVGENAFYGCAQLKHIDLTNVYDVGNYAFHGCRKLTDIEFGDNSHKIGDGAFDSCTSLKSVVLGSVKEIGNRAFCNCRTLARVTIPKTVDTIGDEVFYNCRFMKELRMLKAKPPVLMGTDSLPQEADYRIIVPKGAKKSYASATNWAVYADRIEVADRVESVAKSETADKIMEVGK